MLFNFSEHAEVEDINVVPQGFRSFYEEKADGTTGHKLRDDPAIGAAITNLSSMYQTVQKLRKESKDGQNTVDLTPLQEYGTDVESVLEAINSIRQERDTLAEASKGKVDPSKFKDEITQSLTAKHEAVVKPLREQNESLTSQLRDIVTNTAMLEAISSEPGVSAFADIWKPIVKEYLKAETNSDGTVGLYVIDRETGDKRYSSTTGDFLSPRELVQELASDKRYAAIVKSSIPEGGGATGRSRPTPIQRPQDPSKMNPAQKIAYGLAQMDQKVS